MSRLDEINNELDLLSNESKEISKRIRILSDEKTKLHLNENKCFIDKIYKSTALDRTTFYKILDIDPNNIYRLKTLIVNKCNTSLSHIEEEDLVSIENYPWFCNKLLGDKLIKEIDIPTAYIEITDKTQIDELNNIFNTILSFSNIKIEDDSNE